MNTLPSIPIPASRRWREIRCRILPGLWFVGAVAAVAILWRQVVQSPSWPGPSAVGLATPQVGMFPESFEQAAYPFRTKSLTHHSSHHIQRGLPQETNRPGTALTYGDHLTESGATFPLDIPRSNLFPGEPVGAKIGANRN